MIRRIHPWKAFNSKRGALKNDKEADRNENRIEYIVLMHLAKPIWRFCFTVSSQAGPVSGQGGHPGAGL
jgi:hypothetical protein